MNTLLHLKFKVKEQFFIVPPPFWKLYFCHWGFHGNFVFMCHCLRHQRYYLPLEFLNLVGGPAKTKSARSYRSYICACHGNRSSRTRTFYGIRFSTFSQSSVKTRAMECFISKSCRFRASNFTNKGLYHRLLSWNFCTNSSKQLFHETPLATFRNFSST